MKLTFTVNKSAVNQVFDQLEATAAKKVSVKGFRKGKAPLKLAKKNLNEKALQQRALEQVLSKTYLELIKSKKLTPVSHPKIDLKTVEKNGDFVFEAEITLKPKINLGDYQTALKAATAKSKIWTPDKGNPEPTVTQPALNSSKGDQKPHPKSNASQQQPSTDQSDAQLKLIFDTLLNTVKLTIPKTLIDREVNRMLSRLLDQVNNLGLKIEDYLASVGKTQKSIKTEYTKTAEQTLKLEFILQEIAIDQKITVTEDEINQLLKSVPDEKTRQHLDNPESRINLKLVLLKRKTITRLHQLAS